jgi:adenylylsulfate kinase
VAKLFRDCGIINMTAFISPYRKERQLARELSDDKCFVEVYVDCPIDICEERDPKGMYKKAREGAIKEFTGISAPYEPPENPEIHLRTDILSIDDCVKAILDYLVKNQLISERAGLVSWRVELEGQVASDGAFSMAQRRGDARA